MGDEIDMLLTMLTRLSISLLVKQEFFRKELLSDM